MELFEYFIIYSFLGFMLETVYSLISQRRLKNRKTMYLLPLCPVYGLGALAVLGFCRLAGENAAVVFAGSIIVTSLVEYGFAYIAERAFNVIVWDYGRGRGSIHGRVHVQYSIAWGYLAMALVYYLHPVIESAAGVVPSLAVYAALAVFCVDLPLTAALMHRIGRRKACSRVCPVLRPKSA